MRVHGERTRIDRYFKTVITVLYVESRSICAPAYAFKKVL